LLYQSFGKCSGELQAGFYDYGWRPQTGLPAAFYSEEKALPLSIQPTTTAAIDSLDHSASSEIRSDPVTHGTVL